MGNIFIGLFSLVSAIFLGLSLYFTLRNLYKLKYWKVADGISKGFHKEVSGNGKVVYESENVEATLGGEMIFYPITEFTDDKGNKHTIVSSIGSSDPSTRKHYKEGESKKVIYNPNNPKEANILNPGLFWFPSILLGALGILFAYAVYTMVS